MCLRWNLLYGKWYKKCKGYAEIYCMENDIKSVKDKITIYKNGKYHDKIA